MRRRLARERVASSRLRGWRGKAGPGWASSPCCRATASHAGAGMAGTGAVVVSAMEAASAIEQASAGARRLVKCHLCQGRRGPGTWTTRRIQLAGRRRRRATSLQTCGPGRRAASRRRRSKSQRTADQGDKTRAGGTTAGATAGEEHRGCARLPRPTAGAWQQQRSEELSILSRRPPAQPALACPGTPRRCSRAEYGGNYWVLLK
mmetsp:Transcript_94894/g.277460  ORF Transcript_94894/g.277460 Transcript_94894/m.277460 type:complete len:205 (-) Transcript_94894:4-618(-)